MIGPDCQGWFRNRDGPLMSQFLYLCDMVFATARSLRTLATGRQIMTDSFCHVTIAYFRDFNMDLV